MNESGRTSGARHGGWLPSCLGRHADEIEVLAPDVQRRLAVAVRAGRTAAEELAGGLASEQQRRNLEAQVRTGQRAFDRLLCANLRLVGWCVTRFGGRWARLGHDDLIQEGIGGLARAIEKYDPAMGELSTYAVWWIRQAIGRAGMNGGLVRIPVHVQDGSTSNPETLRLAGRFAELYSVEELFGGPDEAVLDDDELGDVVSIEPGEPADDDVVVARLLVGKVLSGLSAREAEILRRRNGIDGEVETLEEIGVSMNLTRERVRQIEKAALEKSRRMLAEAA